MAYTVSLPFDRRLWRDDIAGSRAHVRGLARAGLHHRRRVRRGARRARSGARRDRRGSVRLPAERRGHPHRRRTAGDRARRRRPAPSCTPPAAATIRWPPTCGCGASASWSTSRARCADLQVVLLDRAVEAASGLPARLHAPPACPTGAARPSPARPRLGARPATSIGCSPRVERLDVSPLGAGALAGTSLPIDPASAPPPSSGSREPFDNSLDAVERPRLRRRGAVRPGADRRPPVADRRGVGALDHGGVRLRPARRRATRRARRCCRRRRTPTSPSSPAASPDG